MNSLTVRTRNGAFQAELDESDVSNAIWLGLPRELELNMLGGMAYCVCNVDAIISKEGRCTDFDVGDIAYWPGPGAICFMYGPTLLSGEDRSKSVSYHPMIKIGRLIGDFSGMDGAGDRQKIFLEYSE